MPRPLKQPHALTAPRFPIDEVLPELRTLLAANTRLVLEAPPGAGKTTQVPPALLDEAWLEGRRILMLEPRRIAARAAAEFMAAARGEAVGATVGYRIRHESKISPATRIEVITEGILTRLLQDDPELPGVGAILFDEFHERHLHGDLGAALALDVQANLRPELRLVIMSATLDGERIARWFEAPRLSSAGRSYPVRIGHPPARQGEAWPERGWIAHLRRAVEQALAESDGDVLVFLPGRREIERAREALAGIAAEAIALHGELALAEQHAALAAAAPGTRRVVLATNVAESSLTLPGIRAVVDLGLAREPRFDPSSGFSRLQTVNISQASADQRAGRAGRLGPGSAYRLWPQSRRLDASRTPEIAQVELSQLMLELKAWGSEALCWLDPPPPGASAQAVELLVALGALEANASINPFGRELLAFGAHPRLAAAVVRAAPDQRALACDAVALIEARNPLRGEASRNDDFRLRQRALGAWRERDATTARELGADRGALAAIAQSADAWRRRARVPASNRADAGSTALGDLLIHAFPDRVARQDPANPRRYQLANGRGARLLEESSLYGEPWLVVIDLRFEERDSLILAAAPFDEAALEREFPQRFATRRSVRWNRESRAVEAFEERCFAAIVLERRSVPARAEDAVPALLAAIRELGLDALPWSDAASELRQRVEFLRAQTPELGLPDYSDARLLETLETWLAPALDGKRRLDALRPEELSNALAGQLDYALRRALDEQAPTTITVPSGLARRVSYAAGAPPVLAVKLQELFGLADTPRVANGRVAVTLHLLSPAGRPIQVTQDLRGFWERTYPQVKKELKGRYPKHPWPDDPWTATATHRAKPRR
ncbi:ATP-dependent helicase HrpB [Dokdonella immobilis]|uniref:ATP-dependent helicase HrpB n=1 Tax=Dokdonella immobilis TaxID=578942 RepID=A0A1I4XX66_9GAMM|nr:ATP-dependent helicase HrpB [Dokdonella immobilis]SFN29829.1 ATP-dependent helicase HrpB [Dokdonella immobilis]